MTQNLKSWCKQVISNILAYEARWLLRKHRPKIVAVTGSVGKTSTKDAIYTILASAYRVRKSEKSYNSETGLPLTILGRKSAWLSPWGWTKVILAGASDLLFPTKYPEWLVLEVGADRPGDISKMMKWLKPDIGVLTRLPEVPVHIEFFPDREGVVKEKMALAHGVKKDGIVIYNFDDETLRERAQKLTVRTLSYGFSPEADIYASNIQTLYEEAGGHTRPAGISFKLNTNGQIIPIRIKEVVGDHQVYCVLAAIAVGVATELNIVSVAEEIQTALVTPPGRLKLIPGIKGAMLLDDTYNSSPAALEAALMTLNKLEGAGRKVAVLGDMLELGEYTIEAHRQAGRLAAGTLDSLLVVGLRAKFIVEGALEGGMKVEQIKSFHTAPEAGKFLDSFIESGDLVLIKGSQGMRLERVVEEVMAEPLRAGELLCRQELEWKAR